MVVEDLKSDLGCIAGIKYTLEFGDVVSLSASS